LPNFNECIDIAQKAGKITKEVAEYIKNSDDQLLATNQFAENLTRQKREAAIQAVKNAEGWQKIESHSLSLYDGLVALLTKDPTGKAGYKNVEYMQKFYTSRYTSQVAEAMSRFRTRRLGFSQDAEGLSNFAKAMFGEAVDDAEIMSFAKQWKRMTENVRKDFNSKGGSISKNEAWIMPQSHDLKSVTKMGLDGWKTFIYDKLDRTKMLDDNGKALSDKELDAALDYVYETITTGGLNKTADFTIPRLGTKLSRRGSEKRFIYFKDADSWMSYQKKAGRGDIFTTLTDWVEMKGSDMGIMDVLGTNPTATFEALKAQVKKNGAMDQRQSSFSGAMFNVVSGKINGGELTNLSDFMATTKSGLSAAILGKAFLSALSDLGFGALTTNFNGIKTFKTLSTQMSLLNPANEADRIFAVKLGLGAQAWLNRSHGGNRYGDFYGTGMAAKLAEGVMRASFLAPWTEAGQKAFGMEFSALLAENFSKTFDEVRVSNKKLVRAMETYGIDEADWNKFRVSKTMDHKGAKYADMMQEGGVKFHQMVLSETDFAVPVPDARVRAMTTGGLERASVAGAAVGAIMTLKSFPLTIATTHFYRAAYQATAGEKLGYISTLLATTTALGAVVLQAKDIAAGRKPRQMDNEKFFFAALTQGGGLGILGDFAFSDVNRFGGGFTKTVAGPVFGLVDDAVRLGPGNIRQAVMGDETNILGEGANFVNRYTPDIWQTQLISNAFFDQLELMADDGAEKRFRRIAKKRQKEYNQGRWIKRGEIIPEALK
jgi:hypothetical protein